MKVAILLLIGVLAGCSGVDMPATMIAQNNSYATEVVTINQTLTIRRTEVVVTAQAAQTRTSELDVINRQWLGLLRAGVTPTPGVQPEVAPAAAYGDSALATQNAGGFSEEWVGANQVGALQDDPVAPDLNSTAAALPFADITTTDQVRDSDGCAAYPQTSFSPDTARIYIVARALTITTGTQMDVDWSLEGQVVWQDSWTVPQDSDDFCLWFYIGPEYLALTPGNWSVQLYANGVAIPPAVPFTVIGQ